ncbi:MAG: sigma-54 dependent transcriptional regulator [Pseudomonadota bacterium]
MPTRSTKHFAPVLLAHQNDSLITDLSHRVQFLEYPCITLSDLRAQPAEDRTLTAIITDADALDELLSTPGAALKQLLQDTPVLLLQSDSAPLPTSHPRVWPIDMPLKRARLAHLLAQAARYRGCQRRQRLTGSSPTIARVRQMIEQVAPFDTNVLISGESGTGKELVARTIHDLSERADAPFVPINCGAIPADLLESELFGHEKGAFTGAVSNRKGRFELAEGGTLFLDEIGDMTLPMQVKLLRVLQERCYERVGSNQSRTANVRIIAATHRDLPEAVNADRFREDLYYRLNVFPIKMPPLRKRLEDIPGLLRELVNGYDAATGKPLRLQPCALKALACHHWPGNVRELGNLVERLAILHPTGVIRAEDLPEKFRRNLPAEPEASLAASVALPEHGIVLKDHLRQLERTLIDTALARSDGVVARAARLLQIRRTTLVEKLRVA